MDWDDIQKFAEECLDKKILEINKTLLANKNSINKLLKLCDSLEKHFNQPEKGLLKVQTEKLLPRAKSPIAQGHKSPRETTEKTEESKKTPEDGVKKEKKDPEEKKKDAEEKKKEKEEKRKEIEARRKEAEEEKKKALEEKKIQEEQKKKQKEEEKKKELEDKKKEKEEKKKEIEAKKKEAEEKKKTELEEKKKLKEEKKKEPEGKKKDDEDKKKEPEKPADQENTLKKPEDIKKPRKSVDMGEIKAKKKEDAAHKKNVNSKAEDGKPEKPSKMVSPTKIDSKKPKPEEPKPETIEEPQPDEPDPDKELVPIPKIKTYTKPELEQILSSIKDTPHSKSDENFSISMGLSISLHALTHLQSSSFYLTKDNPSPIFLWVFSVLFAFTGEFYDKESGKLWQETKNFLTGGKNNSRVEHDVGHKIVQLAENFDFSDENLDKVENMVAGVEYEVKKISSKCEVSAVLIGLIKEATLFGGINLPDGPEWKVRSRCHHKLALVN
ncbi:hypothetical protein SteCoe_30343 [Stentor coeruleus]|uniref:Uncharacterized protein n=1 Tax=Stentor coeruleus TaxID=5963 RepID=A0A1R2B3W3_9CILI|nr:hypothetical protein SteCoe_30343 [Stentor coeruleus]